MNELNNIEISKMDDILVYFTNTKNIPNDDKIISDQLNMEYDEYKFLYSKILEFSKYTSSIGKIMDEGESYESLKCDFSTKRFIDNGGFKKYIKEVEYPLLNPKKAHLDYLADQLSENIQISVNASNVHIGDNSGSYSQSTEDRKKTIINPPAKAQNIIKKTNPCDKLCDSTINLASRVIRNFRLLKHILAY